MRKFVAVTDEILENNPAMYHRLIPFDLDLPCRRLQKEPVPDFSFLDTPADLQVELPTSGRTRVPDCEERSAENGGGESAKNNKRAKPGTGNTHR